MTSNIYFCIIKTLSRQAVGLVGGGIILTENIEGAQETKHVVLNAAEVLFQEKGYDATSTNDILKKTGIARGTLYHHFTNKEAIMDGVVDRTNNKLIKAAQRVADRKDLSVIERLLLTITSLNVSGDVPEELMNHIHKPQNALMHQKIQKVLYKDITPIFATIIQDGIKEGIFRTPYPYESMEMLLVYASTIMDDDILNLRKEEQFQRIEAFAYNMEVLLGTEEGLVTKQLQKILTKE